MVNIWLIYDLYMVNIWLATIISTIAINHLVGGAITILKNMSSLIGRMTSHIWKIKND